MSIFEELLDSVQKHKDSFITFVTEKDPEKFNELLDKNVSDPVVKQMFTAVHDFCNTMTEVYSAGNNDSQKSDTTEDKDTKSEVDNVKSVIKDEFEKLKETGKKIYSKAELDGFFDKVKNAKKKIFESSALTEDDMSGEDVDDFNSSDFIKIRFSPYNDSCQLSDEDDWLDDIDELDDCSDYESDSDDSDDECECKCSCGCHCNDDEPREEMKNKTIAAGFLDEINEMPLSEDEAVNLIVDVIYKKITDKKNKLYILHRKTDISNPAVEVHVLEDEVKHIYFYNTYVTGKVKEKLIEKCGFQNVVFGPTCVTKESSEKCMAAFLIL